MWASRLLVPAGLSLLLGAWVLGPAWGPAWGSEPEDASHDHGAHAPASPGEHDHNQGGPGPATSPRPAEPSNDPGPVSSPGELAARLATARPGQVVVVPPGTHPGNLVIDTQVVLRGMGRPVIQGDGTGTVVTITAPGTVLEGFTVRGSGVGPVGSPAGIRVAANRVVVRDVVVEDAYTGIHVAGARNVRIEEATVHGRTDATITGESHAVEVSDETEVADEADAEDPHADHADHGASGSAPPRWERGDGISIWHSERVLVRDSVVADARDGVFVSFGHDVLIDRNRIEGSRYAVHGMFAKDLVLSENTLEDNLSGAVLMYGGPALLLRNLVRDSTSASTGFGALLKDVDRARVVENVLVGNRVGIQIDGPPGAEEPTMLTLNTVALNRIGVGLYPSASATFTGNSFVENTAQVVSRGRGVARGVQWWHEGTGNHWSTYRGYDLSGDGLGDVPHAEGGVLEEALVRAPVLEALASGPAFRLLGAVAERWVEAEPVALDLAPLARPHSPPLSSDGSSSRARGTLGGVGLALLVLASALVARFRRPARGSLEVRRAGP